VNKDFQKVSLLVFLALLM